MEMTYFLLSTNSSTKVLIKLKYYEKHCILISLYFSICTQQNVNLPYTTWTFSLQKQKESIKANVSISWKLVLS